MENTKFTNVKIGGTIFSVEELYEQVDQFNGLIVYDDSKILIKRNDYQQMFGVLFHECVHGLLDHVSYRDLSSDEQFVEAFSNALTAFVVDNPHIFNPDFFRDEGK